MKKIIISDDRKLNISNVVIGYLQENKIEKLEFEIPKEYENFGRKACFETNGNTFTKTFDNITGNTITLTRDITQYQDLFMTIAFFKIEDEDEIIARTSTLHILIQGAVICDDDIKPDEPKIIVLDNLIQKVQELDNEISLNENERLENENTRQENEEKRINNENLREEYITNLKDKVDDGEFNGKSLEFVWQGTKLGIRLQGQEEYQFVDLVGAVGPIGPQGNPFQVKKTYATIDEMINDYDNMKINDYVMISGNIEEEDNAKLFVKTENETPIYRWQYLADFSGASGIQGPIGKTPNLKIGTVSTLNPNENATVEITGTDENPILNFGIPKGQTYQVNDEDLENIANEITSNANSSFNQNVLTKTNEFNNNATSKVNEYNTNADAKLQEYNTNADNKIAEYDLHSQELDNKIIDTRNELERVKNDVLETGTDTDTYIHLEDSAMAEYQELSVDGVCEQETTTGKNLLSVNFSQVGTNSLTTSTFTLPTGTYTFSYSGNLTATWQTTIYSYIEGTMVDLKHNYNQYNLSFTLEEEREIYIEIYRVGILLNQISQPMLNEGSTPLSYEPYTGGQPSPSPDYPQNISVLTGNLKATSCGKNLFDKDNVKRIYAYIQNKTTWKYYKDSYSIRIPVKPNENYVISADNSNETIFRAGVTDSSDIPVLETNVALYSTTRYSNTNTPIYITTGANAKYIVIQVAEDSANDTFNTLQLEKGSIATPYEPYQGSSLNITIPSNEFIGKLDDTYKDTLNVVYKEDGHYHLILNKMIGKVVLDGSETYFSWGIKETDYFSAYVNKFGNKLAIVNGYIISDHFPFSNYTVVANATGIGCFTGGNYIGISVPKNILSDVSTLSNALASIKEWFSENNSEFYYALATPYVIDLGIVDMPITYNEITNIFTDSDLLPQINAKYYRNFISTVRNLQVNEKALKQELIDINNRLSALESAQTSIQTIEENV